MKYIIRKGNYHFNAFIDPIYTLLSILKGRTKWLTAIKSHLNSLGADSPISSIGLVELILLTLNNMTRGLFGSVTPIGLFGSVSPKEGMQRGTGI